MKPWEKDWKPVSPLGSGGQGTTQLVQKIDDPNKELFVLKILNRQSDPERRKRMYREATTLRTLSHHGIPKFIDSNTDRYNEIGIHLFLVTQFVAGPQLEEKIRPLNKTDYNRLSIDEALILIKPLIKIVQYCHENNVGHRDIKPDNIILRNGDLSDPVLIDFGQTFNQIMFSNETFTNQQMGNRFLASPEYLTDHSNKRDVRSDLSACVGILFFVLTGEYPRTFLDENGAKPHQREISLLYLEKIQQKTKAALLQIFDYAFEPSIERRFQTAQALLLEIEAIAINSADKEEGNLENKIHEFLLRQKKSIQVTSKRESRTILQNALEAVSAGCSDAIQRLGTNDFNSPQTNQYIKLDMLEAGTKIGIVNALDPTHIFWPQMCAQITGAELVILGVSNNIRKELIRLSLETCTTPENKLLCRSKIRDYYLEGFLKADSPQN